MSVFRVNKTTNYTVMSNTHLKDKTLTLKSKGLLSLMLSLPDEWDYSIEGLVTLSEDQHTSVRNALKELELNGYLIRTPIKSKGKIMDWQYDIFENPIKSIKPVVENPQVEKPQVEKPQVENQRQLNTKELNTKELNTNNTKHKYGSYGRIKLSDKELNGLIKDFGEDFIKKQIELVDEYVEGNNNKNKYSNFNLVIRRSIKNNWFKQQSTVKQQSKYSYLDNKF